MDNSQENGCIRLTIRLIRWLPVCFVLALLGWSYYAYIYYLCFGFISGTAQRIVYLFIFNFLVLFVLWAYLQTIFTPIAYPPESFAVTSEVRENLCATAADPPQNRAILEEFVETHNIPVVTRLGSDIRYCGKCSSIKPDRSHHCSQCSRCVLRMDHHCPWLNTCVCYSNYKGFLLVLFYGVFLFAFTFFTILPVYLRFLLGDSEIGAHTPACFNVLLLFFVSGMFLMPVLGMVYEHLGLLTHNRTTIECIQKLQFADGAAQDSFDLGTMENIRQVFGEVVVLWPLPIPTSLGDGVVFPRRTSETA